MKFNYVVWSKKKKLYSCINYNLQILRPDFTIDPHMKVIFEKPYKSDGILKRMILSISYKEGTWAALSCSQFIDYKREKHILSFILNKV